MTSAMMYAVRRTEVRRTKGCGWKFNGWKFMDGSPTKVGQKSVDESSTDESSSMYVWRKLGWSPADVRRKSDLCRTCRAQPPLPRWRAAVLHCSSSQRYNDGRERCSSQRCCGVGRQRAATCSVLATLLQQRAGPRSVAAMASNAVLLQQRVGPCNVAAATRWTSQRCCNGWQRTGPRSVFFFFFFFTPDNLKREKEWEKERSFDTCSLVSRLRLSQ